MNVTALWKGKKRLVLYWVVFFLIMSFVLILITSLIQNNSDRITRETVINQEQMIVDVQRTLLSYRINRLINDLMFMKDSLRFFDLPVNDDTKIVQMWLAFSERKQVYDQIRLLDVNGNERIRINDRDGNGTVVPPAELQNKKDRYYFSNCIGLSEDQVYISPIDLNIENGVIEQPIKPMMRLSTPVFDANNTLMGIVVLNYNADEMLQQIQSINQFSHGAGSFLNEDGYWLLNSENATHEWAFMYPDRLTDSFSYKFPKEWKAVDSTPSGYLVTNNGLFTYGQILTNQVFTANHHKISVVTDFSDWHIVTHVAAGTETGQLFVDGFWETNWHAIQSKWYAYLMVLLISLVIAALLVINKDENDKIRFYSEFDSMTGVYNRRAGLERLQQIHRRERSNACHTSICFIDINGLKVVNDTLGHDFGDELITTVIRCINSNIRVNDFVARMGGDEFLIIFEGLEPDACELVWQRILAEFARINDTEARKYIVSASHGIEPYDCTMNNIINTVISRADEKMYNEKRIIKRTLKIIRED